MAFDVTLQNMTAIITEKGAFKPKDLEEAAKKGANIEEYRLLDDET